MENNPQSTDRHPAAIRDQAHRLDIRDGCRTAPFATSASAAS
jgi:hypothetical protein